MKRLSIAHVTVVFAGILFMLSHGADAGIVGDVNGDGKIDLIEASYALQVSAGVYPDLDTSCMLEGKGTWAAGTQYNECDVVEYNGYNYACTQGHLSESGSKEPPDSNYWTLLMIKGDPGPQGPEGEKGDPGVDGADGKTLLNGEGAPDNAIGNDGDFYIDTLANTLYGPKGSGAWPTPGVSMVGPQGPEGDPGTPSFSNVWFGRLSLQSGNWINSTGDSGTLTVPSTVNSESCDPSGNVCVYQFAEGQYRIVFKIPSTYAVNWRNDTTINAGHCWGTTSGDNEGMNYLGFGEGVVTFGSDHTGGCDTQSTINDCAWVDVEINHLSHTIYGVVCVTP